MQVYAGTGYGQIIHYNLNSKKQQKQVFGAMQAEKIVSILTSTSEGLIFFSSPKKIYELDLKKDNEIREVAKIYEKQQSIIGLDYTKQVNSMQYCLSNGSIISSFTNCESDFTITSHEGDKHSNNGYKKSVTNEDKKLFLLVGKNSLPFIYSMENTLVSWKGKNVKHDELDLEVPINDVDAAFLKGDKHLAILNANNRIRLYDIRGTNKRPNQDHSLKTDPRSQMTRMAVSPCQNLYYFANDVGSIFQCDSRKNFNVIGKFKGITTSITDIKITDQQLICVSLDCYIRIFDKETKELEQKLYTNKPLYSLQTVSKIKQEIQDFDEEEIDLAENEELEQENNSKKNISKVKSIRKRNKVNLKYVRPREFDLVVVKQQVEPEVKEKWYQELNPVDREEFEENST